MKLSKANYDELTSKITSKWKNHHCPMCQKNDWVIDDILVETREYAQGAIEAGGNIMALSPIICGNCGNTILINPNVLGIKI